MHQQFGISLPAVHKRSPNIVSHLAIYKVNLYIFLFHIWFPWKLHLTERCDKKSSKLVKIVWILGHQYHYKNWCVVRCVSEMSNVYFIISWKTHDLIVCTTDEFEANTMNWNMLLESGLPWSLSGSSSKWCDSCFLKIINLSFVFIDINCKMSWERFD